MDIKIKPKKLTGCLQAIPSKSQAHRLLICAAFADKDTVIHCPQTNEDIEATAQCLVALGAKINYSNGAFFVHPVKKIPKNAVLECRESGSTLRFLLPIVGALGIDATFVLAGRLPCRPLSPLWEELERNGCSLSRPTETTVRCQGKLTEGTFTVDGSVSSQFITGLLFAAALLEGKSQLQITGKIESKPYIQMTQDALSSFGVSTNDYRICGQFPFHSPGELTVEGDWSNAAFFLAANTLGSNIEISNLDPDSSQGDRRVAPILNKLTEHITIDAADIPDLVPILAVTGGAKCGVTFNNIGRLRLKESDRVSSVADMLTALGAKVEVTEHTMTVYPAEFGACTVDSVGDHRIAMAAAIAATVASGPVTILNAQCVKKSYPAFWDTYHELGGEYEQHIR